jgi:cobalt/nickel transport system permease protein
MHVPDGFLDVKTAAATTVLAAAGVGAAVWHAQRTLPPRKVPLLGLSAAFIFAAQMLNFPVLAGTSGHLIGAVLAGVLLGPSAGVVAMTAVVVVQCLMFADGGITALGANLFNMAIVGVVTGHVVYRAVRRVWPGQRGAILGAAFAGWCSTVFASVGCAGQLAFSGTAAWSTVFPAMLHVHMLIGAGEGLITALVVAAVWRARPELVDEIATFEARPVLGFGLLTASGLAMFVAPFACGWPDGLEKVASALGFDRRAAETPVLKAPLPDYVFPGVESTALAGLVGTIAVFALAWILARVLAPPAELESR